MKSWKTTTLGILTILGSVIAAVQALIDNDPLTIPNWSAVITAATAGFGLLFARDNSVSSEQAGIK